MQDYQPDFDFVAQHLQDSAMHMCVALQHLAVIRQFLLAEKWNLWASHS